MKIITTEEHHDDPAMADAIGKAIGNLHRPGFTPFA